MVAQTLDECAARQTFLTSLLVDLGFAVKWDRVVNPSNRVQFLGIIIDSNFCRLELPPKKLRLLSLLSRQQALIKKITKKQLQVLIGHLSFDTKATHGARTFTRLFIDVMVKLKHAIDHARITRLLQWELFRWSSFAANFIGLCPCTMRAELPKFLISTGASFTGFGASKSDAWLASVWGNGEPYL